MGARPRHPRHQSRGPAIRMGLEWLDATGFPRCPAEAGGDAGRLRYSRFATEALGDSDRFFSYAPVGDYRLSQGRLTFTSPVRSRYPENDTVNALWFPHAQGPGRALVVLPQWNSDVNGTWVWPSCSTGLASALCA